MPDLGHAQGRFCRGLSSSIRPDLADHKARSSPSAWSFPSRWPGFGAEVQLTGVSGARGGAAALEKLKGGKQ